MQVFISCSSHDKDFASRLCNDLTLYDVEVWFDDWSIRPGDSIPKAIQHGLRTSDFVLLLISRSGIQSNWVDEELNSSLFSAIPPSNHGVSLFSNCGAGDIGYRAAGFRFDVMGEFDPR